MLIEPATPVGIKVVYGIGSATAASASAMMEIVMIMSDGMEVLMFLTGTVEVVRIKL